jgi:hypothetical protein
VHGLGNEKNIEGAQGDSARQLLGGHHFTLKTNTRTRPTWTTFVRSYNPENRHERTEAKRFRLFPTTI